MLLGVAMLRSGLIDFIFANAPWQIVSFVAGIFFTSVITIGPSIAVIGTLGEVANPVYVASIGALGSVIGDLIIYLFVKDKIKSEVLALGWPVRISQMFRFEILRWLGPLIGALIILSPFPDEIGLALMGFSSATKLRWLAIILFCLNFLGILIIAYIGRVV